MMITDHLIPFLVQRKQSLSWLYTAWIMIKDFIAFAMRFAFLLMLIGGAYVVRGSLENLMLHYLYNESFITAVKVAHQGAVNTIAQNPFINIQLSEVTSYAELAKTWIIGFCMMLFYLVSAAMAIVIIWTNPIGKMVFDYPSSKHRVEPSPTMMPRKNK